MNYEQRQELVITAMRDTYKEIDEAIEAIFRQGKYIERYTNLLKVIEGHRIDNDESRIIDLHLGMLLNQMQQMKTAVNDLKEGYEIYLERQRKAEAQVRDQQ